MNRVVDMEMDCGIFGLRVIRVDLNYIPRVPARTYGPPERCYPAEDAEIEILHLWIHDGAAWIEAPELIPLLDEMEFYAPLLEFLEDQSNAD